MKEIEEIMIQWEYKTIVITETELEENLTRYGKNGFELIQVLKIDNTGLETRIYRLFFKKRHGDA